jgi:16S rRNA (uracil1498-N3)-methyltransferase
VTAPRFHVPSAAPGARVELPEHTAHHAREVLRLRPGAAVRVFDGAGAEFEGVLDEVSRRTVSARLRHAVEARPESPLRLVLAVSPLKGDRMELVVQKATELGVTEIWPVVTSRTGGRAAGAARLRGEQWDRVASGAAEQCGRAVVPSRTPDDHPRRPPRRTFRRQAHRAPPRPPGTRRSPRCASTPLPRCCSSGPRAASRPPKPRPCGAPASPPPPSAPESSGRRQPPSPPSRLPRRRGETCTAESALCSIEPLRRCCLGATIADNAGDRRAGERRSIFRASSPNGPGMSVRLLTLGVCRASWR